MSETGECRAVELCKMVLLEALRMLERETVSRACSST